MKFSRRWKYLGMVVVGALLFGALFVWHMGGVLVAPANHIVDRAPADLHVEDVEFPSASGAMIRGWFVAGKTNRGAVILLHGIHADRMAMASRAQFLVREGFSVLLFDFQAHGESGGKQISFGYLESRDAAAAVDFIHEKCPGEKVGIIGVSMGAAAALLAKPPLQVNAMVLESCYPTLYQATEDRLVMRFGWAGRLATPLLTCQLKPRLGIRLDDLRPLDAAKNVTVPKFFIAGTIDQDTTIEEARSLFDAAAEPKECWWVDGAKHEDMLRFAGSEYEKRILAFFSLHLR